MKQKINWLVLNDERNGDAKKKKQKNTHKMTNKREIRTSFL